MIGLSRNLDSGTFILRNDRQCLVWVLTFNRRSTLPEWSVQSGALSRVENHHLSAPVAVRTPNVLVRRGLLATASGGAAMIALIGWFGIRSIGTEVLQAAWSIPEITALHIVQLFLMACAWSLAVGEPSVSVRTFVRLRTIREGVNSLLPVAQIGGQVVLSASCPNWARHHTGAGTILDLTSKQGCNWFSSC
jgi:hypothetical protein